MAERKSTAVDEKVKLILETADELDYSKLLMVRDAIDEKYRAKAEEARERVIEETRIKFRELGISFDEVAKPQRKKREKSSLPAKYRSPDGKEWSGRGATPKWMRVLEEDGGNREDYLIK